MHPLQTGRIIKNSKAVWDPSYTPGENIAAGSLVVIVKTEGDRACVESDASGRHGHSGWVPSANIAIFPAAKVARPAAWWLGYWHSGESTILFQIKDHRPWASGSSTWQGRGEPHFGEFQGHPVPQGGGLKIVDGDQPEQADKDLFPDGCMLVTIAIGQHIAVEDNNGCGGTNVSFTGLYSRSRHRASH
jgi:hypothetical protein